MQAGARSHLRADALLLQPQMCPGDTSIIDKGENLNSCHALELSWRQNCGSRFM